MPPVRFCSACGARLPARPPVTCAACGVEHFRNPKPGANAIVVDGDRVLLVRRAHAPWFRAWCSPGGFCEADEHPLETVEREALEEAGRRVEVQAYLGTWIHEYTDDPDDTDAEVITVAYYLARPLDARVGAIDLAEVSEVGWFGWEELPDPLAPPGTLENVLQVARATLAGTSPALPDRPPR